MDSPIDSLFFSPLYSIFLTSPTFSDQSRRIDNICDYIQQNKESKPSIKRWYEQKARPEITATEHRVRIGLHSIHSLTLIRQIVFQMKSQMTAQMVSKNDSIQLW